MGLLSTLPLLEQGEVDNPRIPASFPVIWARLDLGAGKSLVVVNAHPRPGHVKLARHRLPLPYDFDPDVRDHEIKFVRDLVDPLLKAGKRVLLLGDFNITDREPAYRELAAGL